MNIRAKHHFVFFDEEPRGLQAEDQVLAGDDFRVTLADLRTVAHAPDADSPRGQVFRHVEFHFGDPVAVGGQRRDPEGRVDEVLSNGRLGESTAPVVMVVLV